MELGLSLGQDNEHEFLNLCSMCVMTLGMLSWGMATIQDHRSYMLKKKPGKTAQRHKTQKKKSWSRCVLALGRVGPDPS